MNYHRIKIAAIAFCVIICSICYGLNRNHKYREEGFVSIQETPASSQEETLAGDLKETSKEPLRICYVHICGEVAAPGVYELEEGSRIFQAVAVAGGFTENAAADSMNMAEPVKDGMKIQVPNQEEAQKLLNEGADFSGSFQEGRRHLLGMQELRLHTCRRKRSRDLSGMFASPGLF